jgi:hypothetical protein
MENIVIEYKGAQQEPCKIKLMKMSKGMQWEISASGADFDDILADIEKTNQKLIAKFGGLENGA